MGAYWEQEGAREPNRNEKPPDWGLFHTLGGCCYCGGMTGIGLAEPVVSARGFVIAVCVSLEEYIDANTNPPTSSASMTIADQNVRVSYWCDMGP